MGSTLAAAAAVQERAAAAANRAKAVRLKQPSYVVPYKTDGGKMAEKTMWISSGFMPVLMARAVEKIEGARVMQRPSKMAYEQGLRDVRDVPELQPGGFDGNTTGWATKDPMPDEGNEVDVGWLPGPIDRPERI